MDSASNGNSQHRNLAILALTALQLMATVHAQLILPYGPSAHDSLLPPNDDVSSGPYAVPSPIVMDGVSYPRGYYVSTNGVVSFGDNGGGFYWWTSQALPINGTYLSAHVFIGWHDLTTVKGGSIYHRVTTNATDISTITQLVREIYGADTDTSFPYAIVVTFSHVACQSPAGASVTMQGIIANTATGVMYMVFRYSQIGACDSLPLAGYDADDGVHYQQQIYSMTRSASQWPTMQLYSGVPAGTFAYQTPTLCSWASTYDPFAFSVSPAFAATAHPVTATATQMSPQFTSVVTASVQDFPQSTAPIRFLLLAVKPAGAGSVQSVGGNASFWLVDDWQRHFGGTCSVSKSVTISPLTCPTSYDASTNTQTYTCKVYATLFTPDPLNNAYYMATSAELTVPYSFQETVTDNSTTIFGVFCGVSVVELHCVGTRAGLQGGHIYTVIQPKWATNCQLQANSQTFYVDCVIVPPTLPMEKNFEVVLQTQSGALLSVGQSVAVPLPAATSVNDSAVSISPLPSVVGNEDNQQITVTSKIGGTVEILALSLQRGTSTATPEPIPSTFLTIGSPGPSCTVTWNVHGSTAADATLFIGILYLQITTRVTVGAQSRHALVQDTQYRVESVSAGAITLSAPQPQVSKETNGTDRSHQSLSNSAIIAIAVVLSIVCAAATALAVFRRQSFRSQSGPLQENPVPPHCSENPLSLKQQQQQNPDIGDCFAVEPQEDHVMDVVDLGQS